MERQVNEAERKALARCISLLKAAMAESNCPRTLLKARALIDTAMAIPKAAQDASPKGPSVCSCFP